MCYDGVGVVLLEGVVFVYDIGGCLVVFDVFKMGRSLLGFNFFDLSFE